MLHRLIINEIFGKGFTDWSWFHRVTSQERVNCALRLLVRRGLLSTNVKNSWTLVSDSGNCGNPVLVMRRQKSGWVSVRSVRLYFRYRADALGYKNTWVVGDGYRMLRFQ